jgi:putative addiction module component (TIGR02574 family)
LVNARTRELLLEVLELSPEDRALIAVELEASLDAEHGSIQDVDKAWAEEIQRRVDNVLAGRSRGRPAKDVIAEIRSGLAAAPKR